MDVKTEVVLTAIVVTAGRYAKEGKWPDIKVIVGTGVYLLFLTGIGSGQPALAQRFGLVVLVTTLLIYIDPIAKKLGYIKNG